MIFWRPGQVSARASYTYLRWYSTSPSDTATARVFRVSAASRAATPASTNRLYRRPADIYGDADLAALLDGLERVLLDVANAPDRLTPVEFNALWSRVERSGLLLKLRLKETEVRKNRATSQV